MKGRAFRVSSSYSNKLISEHKVELGRETGSKANRTWGPAAWTHSHMKRVPGRCWLKSWSRWEKGVPGQCGRDAPWLYWLTKDGFARSSLVGWELLREVVKDCEYFWSHCQKGISGGLQMEGTAPTVPTTRLCLSKTVLCRITSVEWLLIWTWEKMYWKCWCKYVMSLPSFTEGGETFSIRPILGFPLNQTAGCVTLI